MMMIQYKNYVRYKVQTVDLTL